MDNLNVTPGLTIVITLWVGAAITSHIAWVVAALLFIVFVTLVPVAHEWVDKDD